MSAVWVVHNRDEFGKHRREACIPPNTSHIETIRYFCVNFRKLVLANMLLCSNVYILYSLFTIVSFRYNRANYCSNCSVDLSYACISKELSRQQHILSFSLNVNALLLFMTWTWKPVWTQKQVLSNLSFFSFAFMFVQGFCLHFATSKINKICSFA